MSSRPPVIDQLALTIGLRLPRREVARGIATMLIGGVAVSATTPIPASADRPRICRADGGACSRNSQCCSGACATDRSLPRRRRNRCGCRPGHELCADNVCADRLDRCGSCSYACPEGLADTCTDGACMCGAGPVCDDKAANACVSGACRCGDQPACTPRSELCNDGVCISGDCILAAGARICIVDPEQNVYQVSTLGGLGTSNRCTSTSDCLNYQPQCGSTSTCVCMAFARIQGFPNVESVGLCAAIPNAWLIV